MTKMQRNKGASYEREVAQELSDWLGVDCKRKLGAARDGAAAVPAALAQAGYPVEPVAQVRPGRFAGLASDGRPLSSLLYGSVVKARAANVGSLAERLAVGSLFLRTVTQVQVADAGRAASQVAVAATPGAGAVRR